MNPPVPNPAPTGVPIGCIIPWAGPLANHPAGFLPCDGAKLDRTAEHGKYQALFNAIGTTWGGDGANMFLVPDLRGLFLRGVDGGTNRDPDAGQRTPASPGSPNAGNHGADVGSMQEDAFQGHRHAIQWDNNHNASYGGDNNADDGDKRNGFNSTNLTVMDPTSDGTHGVPRTGYETRPRNAYVYYLIRAF